MNKTIEINMDSFFANEATRKNREQVLINLAKPQSTKAVEITYLLAGLISDAAEGYTFKNGNDDVMITSAVKRIIELVEGKN